MPINVRLNEFNPWDNEVFPNRRILNIRANGFIQSMETYKLDVFVENRVLVRNDDHRPAESNISLSSIRYVILDEITNINNTPLDNYILIDRSNINNIFYVRPEVNAINRIKKLSIREFFVDTAIVYLSDNIAETINYFYYQEGLNSLIERDRGPEQSNNHQTVTLTYAESERFSPTADEMNNMLHEISVSNNRYESVERVYDICYNEAFPYIPTQMELDNYDYYLRHKNPNCHNPFPIAIGRLADRFISIINKNLALLSIE